MVTEQQEEIQYIKEQVLAKFPLLGVTMRPLSVVPDDRIGTAATDGHRIIYSPKFFSTLSDEQKQFVFAHEVMHVAFNHILRSKGRNQRLWNIATDSVINQILKNEKLPLTEGGVDIAEAVNHSAEEMYEKLLKKKEQRDQEKGQNQEQDQQQQSQSGGADQPQDQDVQNQPEQEQPQDQDGQNQSGQDQPQDQDGQKGQEQSDQQSDGSENQYEQNKNSSEGSEGSEQQKDQSQDGDSNSDQNSSSGQGDENQSDSNSEQSSDNQQGSSKPQKGGQRSQSGSSSQSEDTDWDDSNIDWDNEDEQVGHDTHDIWKEAVEEAEREEQRKQEQANKKSLWDRLKEAMGQKEASEGQGEPQEKEAPVPQDENMDAYEKGFLAENQEKRHEMAEQVREQLNRIKGSLRQSNDHTTLGDVGETQTPVVDWKKMLKKSFDEERDRWSYRRSGSENDYMARVEELEDEGRPDTEVMLDVSGSVNIRLLREFLRQLKPLLKSSKLKVGCFDEFVYDFKEIKTKEDIDHFQITAKSQWTENWDAAVRAFSKKKEVNKIIFTDGYPCPGTMPKEDLKGKNVIWIVYGNKDFNPCCGKVIQVSERQLQSYIQTAAPLSRGGR